MTIRSSATMTCSPTRRAVAVFALAGLASAFTTLVARPQPSSAVHYDVVLRHGTVLDGTGSPRFDADVAIAGDRIAAVGDLAGASADIDVDVRGRFVAPGFINIHSHPTPDGLRSAVNMLVQGVTTEILNADGAGPVDIATQLDGLARAGLAVNVGANIGFNSVWAQVVGEADRRPARADVDAMRHLIVTGFETGAFGVSAGLDYKPGYYATAPEVIRVVSAAAPWRAVFTNHDRLTPESRYSSRVGIAETLSIGEKAGLVPVVTHMKAQGREQGTGQALIDLIQHTSTRGAYAAADAYPYLAGQSGLGALIIPGWALDGGRDRMLERFKDREQRGRIVVEAEAAMTARFGGPQGVFVLGVNRELVDLMRELGTTSPGEAVIRLLEESNRGAILRFGAEADLVAILKGPATSVACDCGAVVDGAAHPRYYGTFPRVLGRYVREQQHLTWEDAIRKMTGLPAATIGLTDRGLIAPGMFADVAVFDPATIVDHATFEQPAAMPEGMVHVLVNGRFALRDGAATSRQSGRALRRTPHMPSRALRLDRVRHVVAKGLLPAAADGDAPVLLSVDVQQAPGDRRARGTVRLDGSTVEITELGVLQTSRGWASLTATGRAGGRTIGLTLVVDRDSPTTGRPTVTITSDVLRATATVDRAALVVACGAGAAQRGGGAGRRSGVSNGC